MLKKEHTFTYKDFSDRKRKNLAILDYVRRKGPLSRTDVSKETEINIVSVSNYVTNYIKKGLVVECGLDISTGGRRPELIKLNLENAYTVGVDIGPKKIIAMIVDLGLKEQVRAVVDRPQGSMDELSAKTLEALEKVFKDFNKPKNNIKLIGIGASGIFDIHSGTIHDTDPKRGMTRTNFYTLASRVEEKFNITTLVGNDATCAAFGELSLNPRSDLSEMLFIYSDVGCGIIINRDIYCGASGSAGEIQLLLEDKRRLQLGVEAASSYGIRGVDLGIVEKAKELIKKGEATDILKLCDGKKENITMEIIFEAAKKQDKLAREILIDAANWLGMKVAYLVNIFNPQLAVIGGGIEKAGSVFIEALTNCVKMYAYEESFNAVKIAPSFLRENVVAIGAASLAVRELFINA